MRNFFCFILLSVCTLVAAQEFNSDVTINAEQTGQPNLSIFKTLETSLEEYINNNKFTNTEYLPQERIDCNFFINVTAYNDTSFDASIQIQASRPVYNSGYKSSIVNFNDKDFSFEYVEFQPFDFNVESDQGNLLAVINYYLYTVLGLDADSFKKNSGTIHFQRAKQIVNIAQTGGFPGWQQSNDTQSRYRYNDDLLSGVFKGYREAFYNYHSKGLDLMVSDTKEAKKIIISSIEELRLINNKRPNSYVLRTFFDAKNNEITRILSGGPRVNIDNTIQTLKSIAPTYAQDWLSIKK